jgi:hypothetical protein
MRIRSRVATLLAAPALLLAACGGDGGDGGTQATAPPQPAAEFYPSIETEEAAPIPTWLHAFGGVGETSPGQTRSVVVDLKAGAYAWFSNASPEQEGAQPLYKRGGEGSLEVTGDPSGAQLPTTPAQITAEEVSATDYRFETSGFKAGTNQITFTNGGGQLHHVVIARLAEGGHHRQGPGVLHH